MNYYIIATHIVIIAILFWSAITLHFITIKIQNNEKKKRQKPSQKVLHSKSRRNQTLNDELPFSEPLTESEKQKLTNGL